MIAVMRPAPLVGPREIQREPGTSRVFFPLRPAWRRAYSSRTARRRLSGSIRPPSPCRAASYSRRARISSGPSSSPGLRLGAAQEKARDQEEQADRLREHDLGPEQPRYPRAVGASSRAGSRLRSQTAAVSEKTAPARPRAPRAASSRTLVSWIFSGGTSKRLSVEDDQVGGLADLDRAGLALLEGRVGPGDRVRREHLGKPDALLGEEGRARVRAQFPPRDGDLDRVERIHRRHRPVAAAGDDRSARQRRFAIG